MKAEGTAKTFDDKHLLKGILLYVEDALSVSSGGKQLSTGCALNKRQPKGISPYKSDEISRHRRVSFRVQYESSNNLARWKREHAPEVLPLLQCILLQLRHRRS